MGQVEDRWWSTAGGVRVARDRCGRGLRWRARYRDGEGRQRSRSFAIKAEAVRFLALVQADLLRGSYLDPGRSRTAPPPALQVRRRRCEDLSTKRCGSPQHRTPVLPVPRCAPPVPPAAPLSVLG